MAHYLDPKYLPWAIPKDRAKPDLLSNLPNVVLSNIIQHLAINALGRLAQVSRLFYVLATPTLYEKDAREEHSRAILWAVSLVSTQANEKSVLKMLDLAKEYGGNVNQIYRQGEIGTYTPLHLAASRGSTKVVGKLLKYGADLDALSRILLDDSLFSPDGKKLASRMPTSGIAIASRHSMLRPLFIPFLMEDKEMVEFLLSKGASPILAVLIEDDMTLDSETINILHFLSARHKNVLTSDTGLKLYFRNYRTLINAPIMVGLTPLFLSLASRNEIAFKEILANGGNIEHVNYMGSTPLMQAITYYCNRDNERRQEWYKKTIFYMVKAYGAKVGNLANASIMNTPLIHTINSIPEPLPLTWKHAIRDIREIIDLLVKYGADLNEMSNSGRTVLHALCEMICQTQQTGSLLDLFSHLVKTGANLNIHSRESKSVLGICMKDYNRKPTQLYHLLLEQGATLVPGDEVDGVFKWWAENSASRNAFGMLQYKDHVSQAAIDSAYEIALGKDPKLFEILQEHFPTTTVIERVASEALLTWESPPKPFHWALEMDDFNGLYINKNGDSLLHLIISRLEKFPKYRDAQARNDAHDLLCRGGLLKHKDSRGKTPLRKLYDLQERRKCPILRLFLMDVSFGLGLIGEEPTQEGDQKRLWRKKWERVLDRARENGTG